MAHYEGPRSRLPDISESEARSYTVRAKQFFEKYPTILKIERYSDPQYQKQPNGEAPEAFIEANKLIKLINFAAKSLLSKGGKTPPILGELTLLYNKLQLALGGYAYRSCRRILRTWKF